jgi:hypothetical protein
MVGPDDVGQQRAGDNLHEVMATARRSARCRGPDPRDRPPGRRQYRHRHPAFPHQVVVDQFDTRSAACAEVWICGTGAGDEFFVEALPESDVVARGLVCADERPSRVDVSDEWSVERAADHDRDADGDLDDVASGLAPRVREPGQPSGDRVDAEEEQHPAGDHQRCGDDCGQRPDGHALAAAGVLGERPGRRASRQFEIRTSCCRWLRSPARPGPRPSARRSSRPCARGRCPQRTGPDPRGWSGSGRESRRCRPRL